VIGLLSIFDVVTGAFECACNRRFIGDIVNDMELCFRGRAHKVEIAEIKEK
jgi:hypothetical protein